MKLFHLRSVLWKVKWCRMHERQSIHGAPNKSGEWRIGEQCYAITSRGSRLEGGGWRGGGGGDEEMAVTSCGGDK